MTVIAQRKHKTIYRDGDKTVKVFDKEYSKADVACSFQAAAIDVLVDKALQAAKETGVDTITVGGGGAGNLNMIH